MINIVTKISDLYDNAKEIAKQTDGRISGLQRQVRVAAAVLHQGKIDIGQFVKFQGYIHKAVTQVYGSVAKELAREYGLQQPVTRTKETAKLPALTTFGAAFPELRDLIK